ncbi:DUF5994 family protein [Mycolicibacterium bacteremicum]|uniref:Uncharacterized protein n=1 Tax=Mycolicibacterium bacteremicum TaxID=564198 RepID=A0A1W9YZG7_MYCBA|nr:DUF5994 family protein [Mycolicibacterium bacteremicum]MCV7435071.1 hypothetical protein [Mycolicibacterium bacteremicum]ORA05312.1 hypothetical protein BST17_08815 [Mycolicibacterium bacteremicum]
MTSRQANNPSAPLSTPRLRLKPKGSRPGHVDGAWWPTTPDLADSASDLLPVLAVRLGQPMRVSYNIDSWTATPRRISVGGLSARLGGYHRQPVDTIDITGRTGDRLTLLVVPTGTAPAAAHDIMMAAAHAENTQSAQQLLHDSPDRG